jgi:festuclavine dehydrogenase
MSASGIPEEYARVLAQLDTAVKQGLENRVNDVVQNVTGKTPVAFEAFVDNCIKNGVWEKQEEY